MKTKINTQNETWRSKASQITYPQAEYDRARVVLMHEPEEELSLGTFHSDAALFKCYLDPDAAKAEHRGYQQILRNLGVQVYTIRDILLKDCVNSEYHWIEGPATEALRLLASSSISFETDENLDADEVEEYRQSLLKLYTPNDLIRILIQRPRIRLKKSAINTGVEAEYHLKPLMNLFYMRDQMVTTAKGIVIGQMNSSQRKYECDLVEFCLQKLGIKPLGRIEGKEAFLEGGDYLPVRDFAFINCGLRTTQPAIDQLMQHDWLGKDKLVVVQDSWKSQIQMHLDTFFNVIDRDLVTLCSNRCNAKPGDEKYLTVSIYNRTADGSYQLASEGQGFVDFLHEQGFEIIPIQPEEEEHFANNFLCIEGREVVMVAGQSERLQQQLQEKGVKVHWAPLTNLTHGYGAAHCMTQIIGRSLLK